MKIETIQLSEAEVIARMGGRLTDYARHVIEAGHEPGVLSGDELRGKARKYGGSYARMRGRVMRAISAASSGAIRSAIVLHEQRRRHVAAWASTQTGAIVRVELQR